MMKRLHNWLQLVFLSTVLLPASAAETPRQYEIELIIFRNLVTSDAGEIWPVDYSLWFEQNDVPADAGAVEPDVTWLPQSMYRLSAERNALGRSSQYRPLAYLAWRQPVVDRASALPIKIPLNTSARGAQVEGTVRVAVERYLHLDLDLKLHLAGSDQPDVLEHDQPEIRLTESRRMRSKEVHYFDNPRFGVIALITPFDAETTSVEP